MNILVNYDLHKYVITIMLDSASVNNVAIKLMRPFLSGFYDELFHVKCEFHIVYLIGKDNLDLVQEPIDEIRCFIVYMFNGSSRVIYVKSLCTSYNKSLSIFGPDEPHM